MNFHEIKDEFFKWALLGLISWIAIQVTDLKQNMASITATVAADETRVNRMADAIVRIMGTDSAIEQRASVTEQRIAKLEARIFK